VRAVAHERRSQAGVWPGAAFGNDAAARHWVGSCIIAVGWGLSTTGEPPSLPHAAVAIVRAGIAPFILLPALRVLLMVVVFVCERDYRFGAIVALVLAIVLLGAALGVRMAGAVPGYHLDEVVI
jgi:hypothetical protein